MLSLLDKKAPLIRFDWQEYGVDAVASEKAGRPIPKTIPFVFITPDKFTQLEYDAVEWLAKKRREAIEGKENPEWVTRWEMQFEAWKKGEELPPEGTPIKTWAAINKEQNKRLIALGYLTIEQLAEVSDTNLAMIGLDGRYLRDLARTTLEHEKNGGKQAKQIADLQQSVRDMQGTIERLTERNALLEKGRETLSLKKS